MTLFVALAALVVISLLCADMLRRTYLAERDAISTRNQLQASLLAESGVARALTAHRIHPAYRGETWELSAADLQIPVAAASTSGPAAIVTIVVTTADSGQLPRITVTADFPAASHERIRARRSQLVIPPHP